MSRLTIALVSVGVILILAHSAPATEPATRPAGPTEMLLDLPLDGDGNSAIAGVAAPQAIGGAARFVEGKFGKALLVAGGGFVFDAAQTLDGVRGSLEFWVKADSNADTNRNVASWGFDGGSKTAITINGSDDRLGVVWRSALFPDAPGGSDDHAAIGIAKGGPGKPKVDPNAPPPPPPPPASWHHVVVTWSSTHTKIYFDGNCSYFLPQPSRQMVNLGAGKLTIGSGGSGAPMATDALRIYGWPLSEAEVKQQFARADGKAAKMAEADRFRIEADWAPGEKKAVVYVDRKYVRDLECPMVLVGLFNAGPDGKAEGNPLDQAQLKASPQDMCEAVIDLSHLGKGKWVLKAGMVMLPPLPPGKEGQEGKTVVPLAQGETPVFDFPDVPYFPNDIGMGDANVVPAPFTPVEVKGNAVQVWGRQATINGLGLPEQITSAGEKLLDSPVTLKAITDGKEIAWKMPASPEFTEKDGRITRWKGAADGGAVGLSLDGSIEYDGLMKFDLTIEPHARPPLRASEGTRSANASQAVLDKLWLEIPVPAARAQVAYGWSCGWMQFRNKWHLDASATGVLLTSKDVDHQMIRGHFVPYFQLMDFDRVLAWLAVNDQGWRHEKGVEPMELVREKAGGPVILRQNFFGGKTTLTEPVTITFYLQAGPMKPLPDRWRAWCVANQDTGPLAQRKAKQIWYTWPDDPGRKGGGAFQPYPADANASRIYNENNHKRGWLIVPFTNIGWPGGWKEINQFYAEMAVLPYRWHVANTKSCQDFFLYHLNEWAKIGLDGVYYDEPYSEIASFNLFTGAYLKEDGTRQAGFTWPQQREMVRRSMNLFHGLRDGNGIVWLHKTSYENTAVMSFADINMDGEWPAFWDGDKANRDLWIFYPLDRMVTMMTGRQYGVVPAAMSLIHPPDPRDKYTGTRSFCALTTAFDVLRTDGAWPYEEHRRVDAARGWFCADDPNVEFFGWWELNKPGCPVSNVSDNGWVTVLIRPGKLLLAVVNQKGARDANGKELFNAGQPGNVTLAIPSLRWAQVRPSLVWDAETGEVIPVDRSTWTITVPVPVHDIRMIRWDVLAGSDQPAPPGRGLVQYAAMDGTTAPTMGTAGDDPSPVLAPPAFGAGKHGQAVALGDTTAGAYWCNFSPDYGAVAMWLNPGDGNGIGGKKQVAELRIIGVPVTLSLDQPQGKGLQLAMTHPGIKPDDKFTPMILSPLAAGQWHHVVVTWAGGQWWLFVDGNSAGCTGRFSKALPNRGNLGYQLVLGSPLPKSPATQPVTQPTFDANATVRIDELAVYDWVMLPADVARAMAAEGPIARAASKSPELTIDEAGDTGIGTVKADISLTADWDEYYRLRVRALDAADPNRVLASAIGKFYRLRAEANLALSAIKPDPKSKAPPPAPAIRHADKVILTVQYERPDGTVIGQPIRREIAESAAGTTKPRE